MSEAQPAAEFTIMIDLLVVLGTAAAVALVFQRIRVALIPAYLVAGTLLGPSTLGLVGSTENLGAVSQLAIILLLFGIGLHLDTTSLRHDVVRMLAVGSLACALSILAGWPVGLVFGLRAPAALAVAMALSLSSTAVVLRNMAGRRELNTRHGRISLCILVIQDLIVMGMLAVVPALARWSGSGGAFLLEGRSEAVGQLSGWGQFAVDALLRVGGMGALVTLGRMALPKLLDEAARGRSPEVMILAAVAAAVAASVLADLLGFSLELGAFLSGFILSGTIFRHYLSGQIGPLRDLFMAVFFVALGMKLDSAVLVEQWWVILIAGAVMTGLKTVTIGASVWALGATASIGVTVGFYLAQAGEFSLIVLEAAQWEGVIADEVSQAAIAIVVLSLILTPMLAAIGRAGAPRVAGWPTAPWTATGPVTATGGGTDEHGRPRAVPEAAGRHAIVAGFGPTGRQLVQLLEEAGFRTTVIELNPGTVATEARLGRKIFFGDASSADVLEAAGIDEADALLLTIPDEEAVHRACTWARRLSPSIFIAARTGTIARGERALELGADHVTVDEVATAEAMRRAVLERLLPGSESAPAPGESGQG